MKIGIIGTGVYSTSIAITLASNKDHKIVMWSENEKLVEEFKKTKKLNSIFNNKNIPKNITVTNSYEETIDEAEIVLLMTGVNYLESVCKEIKHKLSTEIPICIGTKGIANDSKKLVHEIAKKHLKNKISIISGPTFAKDLANVDPVGFTLAGKDKKSREIIKNAFNLDTVYIEETTDLDGVAVCGCVKNIYAIGSGIISGLKLGDSTRALYLTQVYEELGNVLYKFKSSLEILNGLAGFGDLSLTCNSKNSRNYSYGEIIGKKGNKKEAKKFLDDNTVEGVDTLNALYHILKRKHVNCPIINTLYDILFKEENAKILIDLITKKTAK